MTLLAHRRACAIRRCLGLSVVMGVLAANGTADAAWSGWRGTIETRVLTEQNTSDQASTWLRTSKVELTRAGFRDDVSTGSGVASEESTTDYFRDVCGQLTHSSTVGVGEIGPVDVSVAPAIEEGGPITFLNSSQMSFPVTTTTRWECLPASTVDSTAFAVSGNVFVPGPLPDPDRIDYTFERQNENCGPGCTRDTTIHVDLSRSLGTIVIKKETLPDGAPDRFQFTGPAAGLIGDGESLSKAVTPGTYTLVEQDKTGWKPKSIVCSNGLRADNQSSISVPVAAGETVECIFTNSKTAVVRIDKVTTPAGDATAFAFSSTLPGHASFSLRDADQPHVATVPEGRYAITESSPANGWILARIACSGAAATVDGNTVTLDVKAGAEVFCTFTNNRRTDRFIVTGAYGYPVASIAGASASATGVDGGVVVGTQQALSRVREICLTETWTAKGERSSPISVNFLWNGQPGPFEHPLVTLVDRKTERKPGTLTTWTSSEIVKYETCSASNRLILGPWPESPSLFLTFPGRITGLSHNLTVVVRLHDGQELSLPVGSSSVSSGRRSWTKTEVRVFNR